MYFSAVECSEGMVYQQCGPACPQTCDNRRRSECIGGCVDGCFCPSGQVLSNGQCIDQANCSGTVVIVGQIYSSTFSVLFLTMFLVRKVLD